MKKKFVTALLVVCLAASMGACGSSDSGKEDSSSSAKTEDDAADEEKEDTADEQKSDGDVTVVKIGVSTESMPNAYVDEDGNCAGENYEVMCLVDELLDDYEFEYESVSQETILIGLDSGTYAAGISNFFYNDDRAEKYIFPEYPISGGVRGIILRNEFKDQIQSGTGEEILSQFAKLDMSMVPIGPDESAYTLYTDFNENHEEQIKFEVTQEINVATCTQYIMEGRYDGASFLQSNYDTIKDEVDPEGKTFFLPFQDGGFGTWALYAKGQEDLVAAIDEAMAQLYEDGTMAAISEKYYGENVFQYIDGFEYADVEANPDYK